MELVTPTSPLITRLETRYDIERLRTEVLAILGKVKLDGDNQIMLSCRPNSADPNFEGKGKIYNKATKEFYFKQDEFSVFNPNFKGTYLESVWETFPQPIGRFRIAVLPPHRCYSLHRDHEAKFHIPVMTNKHCFFLYYGDAQWHSMPADGSVYRVETHLQHSAVNMGSEMRVHLLLDSKIPYPPREK